MELDPVELPFVVLHRRHHSSRGGGNGAETGWNRHHLVAVAHPHRQLGGQVGEQLGLGTDVDRSPSELGHIGARHLPSGHVGQELMPVTDAQDGEAQFQNLGVDPIALGGVHRGRTAGKNQCRCTPGGDLLRSDRPRDDF